MLQDRICRHELAMEINRFDAVTQIVTRIVQASSIRYAPQLVANYGSFCASGIRGSFSTLFTVPLNYTIYYLHFETMSL